MKKFVFGVIAALFVGGVIISFASSGQAQERRCDLAYRACVRDCNATRDRELAANQSRRRQLEGQYGRDMTDCNVRYLTDTKGRDRCRADVTEARDRGLARLDVEARAIRERRLQCITECRRRYEECRNPPVNANVDVVGTVSTECLPDGAPCFVEVSELCTLVSGTCEECTLSLCGGGEWEFETELSQFVVDLLAAQEEMKNPRVLATSSMKGKLAVLNVPADMKVDAGEQLYLRFSSREKKRDGPLKVTVHRGKK